MRRLWINKIVAMAAEHFVNHIRLKLMKFPFTVTNVYFIRALFSFEKRVFDDNISFCYMNILFWNIFVNMKGSNRSQVIYNLLAIRRWVLKFLYNTFIFTLWKIMTLFVYLAVLFNFIFILWTDEMRRLLVWKGLTGLKTMSKIVDNLVKRL